MIYMMSGLVIACCTTLILISYVIRRRAWRKLEAAVRARHDYEDRVDPFEAAAYLSRMEDVFLQIRETSNPVDWTIILWLGLDGLRINPDGTAKWVKRSGPAPLADSAVGSDRVRVDAPSMTVSPGWLPPSPLSEMSVLYADGRAVEMSVQWDPTMALQAQLDKLRIENTIISMQQQIQQTCATPPLYPGWMQYPLNYRN